MTGRPLCSSCERDAVGVLLPDHVFACARHKPDPVPPGSVWRRLPSPRMTSGAPR